MIIYLFLYLIAILMYKNDFKSFLLLSLAAHLVLILYVFEYGLGYVDYYLSDGFEYINNPEDWITDIDRATWGYINYFEKYYDIFGMYFAKFINIPLLLILNKLLQNLFKPLIGKFNIIIILPYFFFMGISNLRDILILVVIICSINYYFKNKLKYYFVFSFFLLTLYTLRPFIAFVTLITLFCYSVFKNKGFKKHIITLSVLFLVLPLLFFIFKLKINQYLYNFNYYIGEGLADRVEQRQAEELGDFASPLFWIKAHLRYLFTPLPTSIATSLFDSSQSFTYGLTSKILRLINQTIYYGFIFYILINIKKAYKFIKYLNPAMKSFILILFSYFPIYSILHFGGVHQRTKLPFQILVILIGLIIYKIKKLKKVEIK